MDGDRIIAGPDGFKYREDEKRAIMIAFTPLKRFWSQPWFKLMGQIGHNGKERFTVGSNLKSFTARDSGELFLFVNDAVSVLFFAGDWDRAYSWEGGNNWGKATVIVSLAKSTKH